MRTSLKMVMAAIGVAVLASPVMAQSESHPNAAPSATLSSAHGSVVHTRTTRSGPAANIGGSQIRLDDCTHVAFPQCGGNAEGG